VVVVPAAIPVPVIVTPFTNSPRTPEPVSTYPAIEPVTTPTVQRTASSYNRNESHQLLLHNSRE